MALRRMLPVGLLTSLAAFGMALPAQAMVPSGTSQWDDADDAPAAVDITGTTLQFDPSTISVDVDFARTPQFGSSSLRVELSFGYSDQTDATLSVATSSAGMRATAVRSDGTTCAPLSVARTGSRVSIRTAAGCFGSPGTVALRASYGTLSNGTTKQSDSVDVAPDDDYTRPLTAMGGYYLLGADGGIFAFGSAPYYGSTGSMHLNAPVVGMSSLTDGSGYRFVASDGGVFAYGDAQFHGSMGGEHLNAPIVGMATTPTGDGYWLVASDGGIFAFGDAQFHGSMGGKHLNAPIVGMAATADGKGYWLVASDGGIFAFGDAPFHGSMGSTPPATPVVGMSRSTKGHGYVLLTRGGDVMAFGDAAAAGSVHGVLAGGATSIAVDGDGYRVTDSQGGVHHFGDVYDFGDLPSRHIVPNQPVTGLSTVS